MTAEERKAKLRSEVDAKVQDLLRLKADAFDAIAATPLERKFFSDGWRMQILWEVIDELVDEVERSRVALDSTHLGVGEAMAALSRIYMRLTGCSLPEWDTPDEIANELIREINERAQGIEENLNEEDPQEPPKCVE